MVEFLADDPRRQHPVIQGRRGVDHVGETGGGGELGIDQHRHQPHQLGAKARCHVVGPGQAIALGDA